MKLINIIIEKVYVKMYDAIMKIENLTTKFPKKIDGEVFEFMVEDPTGSFDELLELNELNNSDYLVGSGINQIRKRYGSIISINKLSHWSFVLFTRYAKSLNYSNRSASKIIDILVDQMRLNEYKDKKDKISYDELIKFFNRKYIYQYGPESIPEVAEIFVPDFTYHEIPIFREILLALIIPELVSMEDQIWFFEKEGKRLNQKLNNMTEYSKDPKKLSDWIRNENFDFMKEFAEMREIAKLPIEINNDPNEQFVGKKYIRRTFKHSLSIFKHVEDKDIIRFQNRFDQLKEFSKRLGTRI